MTTSTSLVPTEHASVPPSTPPAEILRCSTTADFLAALPLLTGFTDENSLFIVLFQGRRGGNVLRMDLPETQSRRDIQVLLDGIIALMNETGAGEQSPAIVLTTSQRFAETVGPPWGRLAHQLKRRFHREGWRLRELAVIAEDGWCGLLSDKCPWRPLSEIAESKFASSAQRRGTLLKPLSSIGTLPDPDPTRIVAVSAQLNALQQRRELHGLAPGENYSSNWIRKTSGLAESCFGAPRLSDQGPQDASSQKLLSTKRLARFIDAAQSQTPWLVLVLTALTRAEFVVTVALESGLDRFTEIRVRDASGAVRGSREAWSIQHLLHSLSHELPDRAKLRSAVSVLNDAIAHAPRTMTPPLFAFLAWAWWMLGMQSVATRMIARSLEVQPDHELSLMTQDLIAHPPAAHLHRLRAEFDRVSDER